MVQFINFLPTSYQEILSRKWTKPLFIVLFIYWFLAYFLTSKKWYFFMYDYTLHSWWRGDLCYCIVSYFKQFVCLKDQLCKSYTQALQHWKRPGLSQPHFYKQTLKRVKENAIWERIWWRDVWSNPRFKNLGMLISFIVDNYLHNLKWLRFSLSAPKCVATCVPWNFDEPHSGSMFFILNFQSCLLGTKGFYMDFIKAY